MNVTQYVLILTSLWKFGQPFTKLHIVNAITKLSILFFGNIIIGDHCCSVNYLIISSDDIKRVADENVIVNGTLVVLDVVREYFDAVELKSPLFFVVPLPEHDIQIVPGDKAQLSVAQTDIQDRCGPQGIQVGDQGIEMGIFAPVIVIYNLSEKRIILR
jgi:hypothetical protein